MIVATKAIVIRTTKFGDTSLIVKTYTRSQGHLSFIVKNAYSKKSRFNVSMFSPLSVLDVTYNDNSKDALKYFKDLAIIHNRGEILFNPVKNTIFFFYNEILYKLLVDFGPDEDLFDFMVSEIEKVGEAPETSLANLPVCFVLRLTNKLGYFPSDNYSSSKCYFQLQDACFVDYYFDSDYILSREESYYLHLLLSGDESLSIPYFARISILRKLVLYLQINNEHIKRIDSLEILTTLLR